MTRLILIVLLILVMCFAFADSAATQPPKDKQDPTKDKKEPPKIVPPPPKPAFNPNDRRPPAPEYALAFLGTVLILAILCMPSRKGY